MVALAHVVEFAIPRYVRLLDMFTVHISLAPFTLHRLRLALFILHRLHLAPFTLPGLHLDRHQGPTFLMHRLHLAPFTLPRGCLGVSLMDIAQGGTSRALRQSWWHFTGLEATPGSTSRAL